MNQKATLLVVDDTPTNIDILVDLFEAYTVAVSLDGLTAIEMVQNMSIDLILLDIMMPGLDGFEVCKRLKEDPKTRDVPVIFITAKTDEESIEAAYDAGGVDYVSKPFKPREVLARVRFQLERAEHIRQLEFFATRDPMTGIYNRRMFFKLAKELFKSTPENTLFGVILDIDHFKKVNDTYGHPAGDTVIREVAQSVFETLPSETIFGRIGGEEFAIFGTFISKNAAFDHVEQCRKAVERLHITHKGVTLHCTISTGIACKSSRLSTLDLLLNEADTALYEAKGRGRNKSIFRK